MKLDFTKTIPFRLAGLLIAFFWQISIINAQNATDYSFSATERTYAPITGGTLISNNTNHDNQFFSNRNIGFSFKYLGITYTNIGVAINGFASFNDGSSTTYPLFNGLDNSISPLSGDLRAQAGSELRMQTSGTAPNRVCVIQWKNYRWSGENGFYNFQLRLYETSNKIEFHYGDFTHSGGNQVAQVSINRNNTDFQNRTGANSDWTTTNTDNNNNTNSGIALRGNITPTNGLVFAFAPPLADLSLNISANTASPCEGQVLIYELSLTNSGPASTQNTTVNFNLPSGLTFVEANADAGSYNTGSGNWVINNINSGENIKLLVKASINTGQGGNNILANSQITTSSVSDNNALNNSSNITVTVTNNSLPEISPISNQSIGYNQVSAPINFTISDVETATEDLILTLNSSNTTVIPLSGLVLSGSGENRTLTITAGLNQFGNSDISIEVSDGTCAKTITFNVEVFKQTYSNFESAKIVVGQVDFNTINTNASQINAPGSNSSAVSAKGVLAVGSQTMNRVLIWNSVPDSDGQPADVVVGQTNFTNTVTGTSNRTLRSPDGVAFSPDGNKLIVADAQNHRILIWNTVPTSNNQPANVVIGQTNFTNRTSGTADNKFDRPTDVQVTPSGKMIVTDRNNNRVLIFNKIPTTNNASADVVIGQTNFTNGGAATSNTRLRAPWNTSIAPDGKLLIADDGNNRVLVYNSIPTYNGAAADVVIGQSNFGNNGSGNTANRFNGPGVTVSPSGVVAVADFSNHRALIFNEIPTTNNASADIVLGQRNFTENVSFNNGNGQTGAPSNRNMNTPYGINFDLNERLYINGRGMNRMMVFGETPNQEADLSVSFASNNGTPCVNGLVSYTVNVTNNGPNNGTNVIVTSALPYGFTPVESIVSSGTYNQSSGFWTIPLISNGETVSLEMRGTVNLGENLNSITAYASVRSYNQVDTDFSNNSGNVTVVVEDNIAPTITAINDIITDFNTPTAAIPFTVADTETAAGVLTVTAHSSNTSIIPHGNVAFSGSGANRSVVITPLNNQFGTVTITLTVEDGKCSSSESFDVFVGNIWLGNSSDWTNAANWSTGIPGPSMSAFIPASPVGGTYPVVNSNESVSNIIISSGARITVNATRTLNVYGNFSNEGSVSTGNGIINMRGNAAQQVKGIVGTVNINNANGVNLNGNMNVQGTLTLTAGNLNIGANTLSIRNPIAGNATNLSTNNTSSITIEGSSGGIILPSQVNQLNNLTLSNGNGLTMNGNLTLRGNLNMTTGSLRMNGRNLTLNGNINSTGGTLSGDINSNLTIGGNGNNNTLVISPTNNYFNNFEFNRNNQVITITNDLKIAGSLLLSNGVVKTDNGIISVENTDPNSIPSFSETAYVNGKLRRCVDAGQDYNFPVGSANHLENAWLKFESISESTCIDAEFIPGMTGRSPNNLRVGNNDVDDILSYGFWRIKPTNTNAIINYNISITSIGHTNGSIEFHHVLLKRDDESQDWSILGDHMTRNEGGSYTNPITVSRSKLLGFSDFAVGVSSDGPLPISLTYFEGSITEEGAELEWRTASEVNNDYFEVQKSTDGKEFTLLGIVQGNGTTDIATEYMFLDNSENKGVTYYRLKQVDYNDQSTLSQVVVLNFKEKQGRITFYPNPVKDIVNIILDDSNILYTKVTIFDMAGKIVKESTHQNEGGRININLNTLPEGAYQIKTQSETATGPILSNGKLIKK
ncbi:hypothetical protein GCM10011506_44780 [Marivirga lumbricoides]|uniref:Secretion system C-terminal sorting domain-containing protein n=1 Tax=Marivirga lumbricoides TaxID=1046115 RepID=A0ABQ1N4P2_9BACT|nr:hypothetical protein GCM10011506_44780 [Marivirga lumbricoides]